MTRLIPITLAFLLGAASAPALSGKATLGKLRIDHPRARVILQDRSAAGYMSVRNAGGEALEPGGHHLMIFGLKKPLKPGDTLPLTVEFEKAGRVAVDFEVVGIGAR